MFVLTSFMFNFFLIPLLIFVLAGLLTWHGFSSKDGELENYLKRWGLFTVLGFVGWFVLLIIG